MHEEVRFRSKFSSSSFRALSLVPNSVEVYMPLKVWSYVHSLNLPNWEVMSQRNVYVLLLWSLPYCLVYRYWQFPPPCPQSQAQEHGFFVICDFRVYLFIRLILQLGFSTNTDFYFIFSLFVLVFLDPQESTSCKIQIIECRVLVDPIFRIFHLRQKASTSHNLYFLALNGEMLHWGDALSLT